MITLLIHNSQFIIMITSVGYDLPERTGKHVNS